MAFEISEEEVSKINDAKKAIGEAIYKAQLIVLSQNPFLSELGRELESSLKLPLDKIHRIGHMATYDTVIIKKPTAKP